MYTNHFSLQSLPFENVPDPAYFFDHGDYNRVFSRMIDSLRAGRGMIVVAGPIGTGKTTLGHKLMASVPEKTRIIWLGEPPDTSEGCSFSSHRSSILALNRPIRFLFYEILKSISYSSTMGAITVW